MAKPNILIILADDLGVDVLRINANTRTVVAQVNGKNDVVGPVAMPTFSRLVASGVHFQYAWAHPACTPTRASLWTGRQVWKTKLGFATGGSDDLESPTVDGETIQTLAQALVGYKCAMFGKWDLGFKKTPVEWGWHEFAGIFRGGVRQDGVTQYGFPAPPARVNMAGLRAATRSTQPKKCADAVKALETKYAQDLDFLNNNPDLRNYIWEKDTVGSDGKARPRIGPLQRTYIYITEDQVADAKQWIGANQGPWCVALNLVAPHDPYHMPPRHTFNAGTIKDPKKPTAQEMLVAMVESIDYYINDLLKAIESQLANTVVIFVCDNGTQETDPDDPTVSIDDELGDDKATSSIGGVHVPMIIADGGLMMGGAPCYVKTAPRSTPEPVHIIDIYNTALDIAGLSSSSQDSISIAPHLDTSVQKPTRTHNFSQMYLKPGPGQPTPGIGASASDTASRYKLTCELLLSAGGAPVDRSSQPTTNLVFDYKFSYLTPDPAIPGSFKQKLLGGLTPNADGTFTISDLAYHSKILELHAVLARERLYADLDSTFPTINKSSFEVPATLLDTPVLIENLETKRYLFSEGSVISGDRGAERGWKASSGFESPNVLGADANYYNRALWIIRKQGDAFLIENSETKRYLFSDGPELSRPRGDEGGWLASSGFQSPKLVGADANYYNRALWVIAPQGDAFLLANWETKRYAFSDGSSFSGNRGDAGGWLAAPGVVGADANYYNRALWLIKRP